MEKQSRQEIMISVIIPTYNSAEYLQQAVESAWTQTVQAGIEVILIDDCSTDNTQELVHRLRTELTQKNTAAKAQTKASPVRELVYHRNPQNAGVAESRNTGIRMARGSYVAFLDADDWWEKDKLDKQYTLAGQTKAALVFTARELMHPDGSSTGRIIEVPQQATYKGLLKTNCIPCSSVLLRTEIAREFYMEHPELHEDYILWLRILQKYEKVYGINEPLLKCRQAEGGKSRNKWKSAKMHFGVYHVVGVPRWKAVYYFCWYAVNGVMKYKGK